MSIYISHTHTHTQEMFIPDDLMKTWDNRWCLTDSEIPLPAHLNHTHTHTNSDGTEGGKFTGINAGEYTGDI